MCYDTVAMDFRDLLTEVSIFLRVTLAQESLSEQAQKARQQLIAKLLLIREESPPHAYTSMNGSPNGHPKLTPQISEYYEEVDNSLESKSKEVLCNPEAFDNTLYNNLSLSQENVYANNDDEENYMNIRPPSRSEENTYTNPSSHLANTPLATFKPPLPASNPPSNPNSNRNSSSNPPSNPNSNRNSIASSRKDLSDSSSFSSSSTRYEDSPEVGAPSASALRYSAVKCGFLGRREKILFMEHTKQYWVAVLNQTLYMFSSDKDRKAVDEIDITGYKARPVAITNSNHNDSKIELVRPGKKTYQFTAEKEMEEWISALNAAAGTAEDETDFPARTVRSSSEQPAHLTLSNTLGRLKGKDKKKYSLQVFPPESNNTSSRNSTHSLPFVPSPKEARRLPLLPHEETYDMPERTIRPVSPTQQDLYEVPHILYQNINDKKRELRQSPQPEETYDQPGPTIRPVTPEVIQEAFYSDIDNHMEDNPKNHVGLYGQGGPTLRPVTPEVIQEDFYSNIDSQEEVPKTQEAIYKNTGYIVPAEEEDSNYCNLGQYPEADTDKESFYDVIAEQRYMSNPPLSKHLKAPSPKPSFWRTNNNSSRSNKNNKTIWSAPDTSAVNDELKLKFQMRKMSLGNKLTTFN